MIQSELHRIDFGLSQDGRKVIASYEAGEADGALTLDELKAAVADSGFGEYRINEIALEEALAKYHGQQAFQIAVADAVDAKFQIRIDPDKMAARLSLERPQGGNPVTLEAILGEIERQKIAAQLDVGVIESALREGFADRVVIASGRPPVPGVDGKLESLIPDAKDRHPHLDEKGIADFHDLGDISVVHAGDALMRRTAPTEGEAGVDVYGQVVAAKPGKAAVFASALQGAEISPEDPDLLLASVTGQPVLLKNGVSVEPTFTLENVDIASGNVAFEGSIHVSEDVQSGMTVRAEGDIHVDGTVENAILDAGGDIVVRGGILGGTERQATDGFHPEVKAKGSLNARFAQKMSLTAGQGIFIDDVTMQCQLSAGRQIIVGAGGGKGQIVGGTARAGILVKAKSIGSDSNMPTTITVGADPALHDRLKIAVNIREAWEGKLFNLVMQLEKLHGKQDAASQQAAESAERTRVCVLAELDALLRKENELKRELELANEAAVVAEKRFFGGVEIIIGNKRLKTADESEGGAYRLVDGELVFQPD